MSRVNYVAGVCFLLLATLTSAPLASGQAASQDTVMRQITETVAKVRRGKLQRYGPMLPSTLEN